MCSGKKNGNDKTFLSFDGGKLGTVNPEKGPQVNILILMVVQEVGSYSRFEAEHENLALLPNGLSTIIIIFNSTPPSMVPWGSGTTLSNSPGEIFI